MKATILVQLTASQRPVCECVVLSLPMPPSNNALYANRAHGGRMKTVEYREWIRDAGWRIQAQHVGRVPGHFAIEIQIERPARAGLFDLMNRDKAIPDLLKNQGIIDEDSLCEEAHLSWLPAGEGCLVTVRAAAK